jgi:amino acid adenylation domain-containing protein/thioester reductase-like protein
MHEAIELSQAQIDSTVQTVPGGAANVQDIYSLSPPQEGVLFHRLLNKQGDVYVLSSLIELQSPAQLARLIDALQTVIDRHDILRTAVLWENLPQPLQVVYRTAALPIEQLQLDPSRDAIEQIKEWMQPHLAQMDIRRAPLARLRVATTADERCYALLQLHHLACDDQSWGLVMAEAAECLEGRERELPKPRHYRDYVTHALSQCRGVEAESFFRDRLRDIDEPTAPFGLLDVHGDGSRTEEASALLDPAVAKLLRAQARRYGVSCARLFHAVWALVVAHGSSREDVVFGTVLLTARQRTPTERMLGMSINTLPLRLRLADATAETLVRRVHSEIASLLVHQHTSLALALQCSAVDGAAPLFTALLNYRHRESGREHGSGRESLRVIGQRGVRTNYPIALAVDDLGEGFALTVQTDRQVDPHRVMGYVQTASQSLAEALEHAPDTSALALPIVPERERRRMLEQFSGTLAPFPSNLLVHELFEEQARRTPEAIAVEYEGICLSFAELERRANRLAWQLRARGVGPDRLVAICVERSVEMIVGVLAILKAGGAYVPLDPNYPSAQLAHILSDAAPSVMVTQRKRGAVLPATTAETIWIDEFDGNDADGGNCGPTREQVGLATHHLAYVIYTSGSTGKPKGVMIEHRNVVSFWQSLERLYEGSAPCRRVGVNASFNFDASVQQFVQMLSGRTIVLVPQACRWDAHALLAFLDARRIEAIDCTPWQLRTWIAAGLGSTGGYGLRLLLVGGEAVDPELWRSLARCTQIDSYNVYGPTENTVDVSAATLRGSVDAPHIGRPMENRRIYVLDRRLAPVPVGVTGELYVGGEGVARGYLNNPELSAQRFVSDPYSAQPGSRMYKTGDIGRWKADGTLEYLGRNDHQVKIRGFRVELGEIEAQLARHEGLKEAVVVAREAASGEKRLVAYVVAHDALAAPSVDTLRVHLKETLPDHMVPSAFVVLEQMPLTPSGKLDRRALPAPGPEAYVSRCYEAPQGEVEELLARIWRTLLNAQDVGRNDNFFELGGHSLLIVQLLDRLRGAGLCVDVRSIFESPTLADLARYVSREAEGFEVPANLIPADCEAISPAMLPLVTLTSEQIGRIAETVPGGAANVQDIYPLAPLQEGILFHHVLHEGRGDVYVVPTLLAVDSREHLDRLVEALQFVVDRHDVLRTAVLWEQLPQPVQVVYRRATLQVDDVALDLTRNAREQVAEWMRPERQRLDLTRAPLMRLRVMPASRDGFYVLMQLHHIIEDAISMRTLIAEVVAWLTGVTQWPESVPYRNHVARSLALAQRHDSEAFFRSRFGDVDEPAAPFGILDVHGDGTQIEEFRLDMDPGLARRVRSQARSLNVSAATLFHAAWGLVVACCSGRSDVVFGTVLLGRLHGNADNKQALGMFINTLPLRLTLDGMTASQLVERTQQELIELLSHEQASLAAAQRCSGVTGSAPLFTALLNYRHTIADPQSRWSRARGIRVLATLDRTNYPVTLSVGDLGEEFKIVAQTDRRIDPRRVAGYVHTAVESLVDALESAPQTPAARLAVVPDSERTLVTRSFNATHAPIPEQLLVHDLVEQQVLQTPDAVAVEHRGESLTYEMLNRRANQLARYLLAHGATPDRPVGIFVERSIDMVVCVLGTLKAGAAYLPLDPNYPSERLQYMLEDAAPTLVLTQTGMVSRLPRTAAEVFDLDAQRHEIGKFASQNLDKLAGALTQESLVYLIYTSGSTGRPKGTAMPHRAMVNLLEWHRHALSPCQGVRVVQFAALSFDVAFQEMFSTLSGGGTLVLLDENARRDVAALLDLLRNRRVHRLFVPPLMLQSLAEQCTATGAFPSDLRDVITAGEQLRISREIVAFFNQSAGRRLHNHYGPTETHVVTALTLTGNAVLWPPLPSIGAPIANTQIFILDEARQPVPVGVPGEIYISGANVARGYWQRPDVTEARFVPNAFSDDPEARMYRTGDVGRWSADGSIDYLGRNDHQIKIRGYRIELGEIEAQLAQHTAVREVAVIAREDVPGDKRLVGYVVPRDGSSLRTEELRAYLKRSLPEYMVPSAWVLLDRLPVTPSGKLHRNALPAPSADAYTTSPYDPPQGATELSLAQIWQGLLRVERVGRADDFFELGAHSLLVLKALLKINAAMDCALKVADIYRNPTVRGLAARIQQGAVAEALVDLEREACVDEQLVARPVAPRSRTTGVLLTGATGFVGRFLLAQLLRDTDATIYCLVRAQTVHQALSKLRAVLNKWSLWPRDCETRVVAVPGDLRLPRLGIDEHTYQVLATQVGSIYHCATSMNHLETYAMAKPVNVDSARELLRFAGCLTSKVINFVSTLGVFTTFGTDTVRIVNEGTAIDCERHVSSRGYVASKWVGEKIFMKAHERGIPCNIFRVGLVWADAKQGRYDELQRGYRILKSCLLSGYGIENYRYEMPPTPVDYVARAIVFLARCHAEGGGVFHVSASKHPHGGVFERLNAIASTSLALLPYFDWILEMKRLHAAGWSLPAVPLIEFAFSMDREAFQARQRRILTSLSVDCSRTYRELELGGISAPTVNDDVMAACIARMIATDPDLQQYRVACEGSDERADAALIRSGQVPDHDLRRMDAWR